MSETDELLRSLMSGVGWLSVIAMLAIAIVAVVKLRATPSGVLLGLGFFAQFLGWLTSKLVHAFYVRPALEDAEGDYDVIEAAIQTGTSVSSCLNVANGALWILIAVGFAMIPTSLARLRKEG